MEERVHRREAHSNAVAGETKKPFGEPFWKRLITGCHYGKIVPDDRIFVTEVFLCFFPVRAREWSTQRSGEWNASNAWFRSNPIVKRHSDLAEFISQYIGK